MLKKGRLLLGAIMVAGVGEGAGQLHLHSLESD